MSFYRKKTVRSLVPPEFHSKDEIVRALNSNAQYRLEPNGYHSYDVIFTKSYVASLQKLIQDICKLEFYARVDDIPVPPLHKYFKNHFSLDMIVKIINDKDFVDGMWGPKTKQTFLRMLDVVRCNEPIYNYVIYRDKICLNDQDKFKFMVCTSYGVAILNELMMFLLNEATIRKYIHDGNKDIILPLVPPDFSGSKGGDILYKLNPATNLTSDKPAISIKDGNTLAEEIASAQNHMNSKEKHKYFHADPEMELIDFSLSINKTENTINLIMNGVTASVDDPTTFSIDTVIKLYRVLNDK